MTQFQSFQSIASTTGLTTWLRKRVQAPNRHQTIFWTSSTVELNGSFPLRVQQMAVSRNQWKQTSKRFGGCTHLWQPQRCFAKANPPQKANCKGRKIQIQPPRPSLQCLIDPGTSDGANEHNGAKHDQQIWANNSKGQTYLQPELEMVLQHICQHLYQKRAPSGVLIRLLHSQANNLGDCSEKKKSRSADSCVKNWLQVGLILRNTPLWDGPPSSNATPWQRPSNHQLLAHFQRHTLPIRVGDNVRNDSQFSK